MIYCINARSFNWVRGFDRPLISSMIVAFSRMRDYLFRSRALKVIALLLGATLISHTQTRSEFEGGVFSTSDTEFGITLSPTIDEAYFARGKGKWAFDRQRMTIYQSKKRRGKWSPREPVEFSGLHNDSAPFLAKGGKRLFFSSDRPNASGGRSTDIWLVERPSNGKWSEPRNAGRT